MFSALFNFCCRQIYDVKKACVYFQQSSCVFNVPEMHLLFGKTTCYKNRYVWLLLTRLHSSPFWFVYEVIILSGFRQ